MCVRVHVYDRMLLYPCVPNPVLRYHRSVNARCPCRCCRYLSARLVTGAVHVFHMHPGVVCPPTPPTPVDVDEVTRILAQKALTGFDTDDEDGENLKATLMKPTAAPKTVPKTLFAALVVPPPTVGASNVSTVFVHAPLNVGGISCVRSSGVDVGGSSGDGASQAGSQRGSVAKSKSPANSAVTGGRSAAAGQAAAVAAASSGSGVTRLL